MSEESTFQAIWSKWMAETDNPGGLCKYKDDFKAMFDATMATTSTRTCDTCQHWNEVSGPDEAEPLGMCRQAAINHWHPGYKYDNSKAWVADEDDDWGLGTGPKFGCVHHQTKL